MVVYIVNINEPQYSKYCIESWNHWCDKHGAQLITLTEPIGNIEPHWGKIFPFQLLEANGIDYDRVLVVDNDTVVHPNCPNVFDLVPRNKVGVVYDDVNYDWTIRSTEAYYKHVFSNFNTFDPFEYFNSGFLVLSSEHKKVYDNIVEFMQHNYEKLNWVQSTYGVGRDQTPLNFLIREFSELEFLSKRFNLQGLYSKELTDVSKIKDISYVSHFNAIPRDHREPFMKSVYTHLYE
jgi:lipopolysaccharide biosynthesis glycosyltransferase